MDGTEQNDLVAEFSSAARNAIAAYRKVFDTLPADHPKVADFRDAMSCFELALTFYEEANRAIQAELWFAAAPVAAAALEAMLLVKLFMDTESVAALPSFKKLLEKHTGDFGKFARQEMNLGAP